MSNLMHPGVATVHWQAGFLNVLLAVATHARIQFRHWPAEQRQDAIQEAIAAACVSYRRLALLGRLHVAHPGTLANYAVDHVRNGLHVGGSRDGTKDVLSPACQRRHGVKVQSYDVRPGKRDGNHWKELVIADGRDPIPDTAAFRIDFEQWLGMLTRRDRKMIAAFIRGDGTLAVAGRFGVSAGRVSQLRQAYENLWEKFQSEVVAGNAA